MTDTHITAAEFLAAKWEARAAQLEQCGKELDKVGTNFFAQARMLRKCIEELREAEAKTKQVESTPP